MLAVVPVSDGRNFLNLTAALTPTCTWEVHNSLAEYCRVFNTAQFSTIWKTDQDAVDGNQSTDRMVDRF